MRARLVCLAWILFPFLLSAEPVRISGSVLADGKPLAGAEVELRLAPEREGAPGPLQSTRTDKDGSFELAAPEIGAYRVVVRARSRLAMEHLVVPLVEDVSLLPASLVPGSTEPMAPRAPIDLGSGLHRRQTWYPAAAHSEPRPRPAEAGKPAEPKPVTGRVTDARTRKPIAGALVWSGLPPERPPVRTGQDGTFRLPVPPGGTPWIGVAAPGYQIPDRLSARKGTVAVALEPAATVRGQVVGSSGEPVAGALVTIQPRPSRARSLSSLGFLPFVRTRDDGGFSIPDLLPGGIYTLTARRSGYGQTEVRVRTAPPGGQPLPPVRLVVGPGITATGRVVDEAGDPVEGAEVAMVGSDGPMHGEVFEGLSKESGVFSIPHLSPGPFLLSVRRAGFAALWRDGVQVPEGQARFEAGELVLKTGVAIEGRITDERGRAVEGAEIGVFSDGASFNHEALLSDEAPPPDARSGPDGRFRIEGLEPRRLYNLLARHPDHLAAMVPGIEAPTDDPVQVELQEPRSLSLRVVGPEEQPVPDAEVQVVGAGLAFTSGPSLGRTDSRGELRSKGLKPGTLDLEVTARGYRDTRWGGVQIPRDRDPDPVTVTLEPAPALEGRVRDEEGNPVPDARIRVEPKVPAPDRMMRLFLKQPATDPEGRFRIDGLEPGEYSVSARMHGTRRQARADVRLGWETAPVELVFEREADVSGRVVDEMGDPVPSAYVRMTSAEGDQETGGYSEADGSFRVQAVQEGEMSLVASARGYAVSEPQVLRVTGSGVEGIEIRLSREAAGTITGRVLGLSPEAFSRVEVAARYDGTYDSSSSRLDEQGRYRLSGLRSGTWQVTATQANGPGASGEVRLEPGGEAVLDLQFPEGLLFSGRISLGGAPLRGAQIAASSAASVARARSDSAGRFSLGPLKEGPHSVFILSEGWSFGVFRTVVLQEGREVLLEIETGGLLGRIVSSAGEPVPGADVQVRAVEPASGEPLPLGPSARSDDQGRFELPSLPSGTYAVIVEKPGFREARTKVEVRPGPPTVQDIVLAERE